eukprot:69708-Alexandrium_andersonii.AAC.1
MRVALEARNQFLPSRPGGGPAASPARASNRHPFLPSRAPGAGHARASNRAVLFNASCSRSSEP